MTPHQQKLKGLVDRLVKATEDGSLAWLLENSETAKTSLNAGTLVISTSYDSSGQDAIQIIVFDKEGRVKLSFDDTALEHTDWDGNKISYYITMRDLLDSALRSARGEDQILDALLKELDDEIPF
jgi:hypothetical protein